MFGDVVSKLRIVNKAAPSEGKHPAEQERRARRGGSDAETRSMHA